MFNRGIVERRRLLPTPGSVETAPSRDYEWAAPVGAVTSAPLLEVGRRSDGATRTGRRDEGFEPQEQTSKSCSPHPERGGLSQNEAAAWSRPQVEEEELLK